MLDGLFVTPVVDAIRDALKASGVDGKLAVVGDAKLAMALAAGHEVVAVGIRDTKKLGELATLAALDEAVPDASFAGVIANDLATDPHWQTTVASWTRVVADRGVIVTIDRGNAHEASRRALCAGLTEIEQRHAGRSVVTSGLVVRIW